MMLYWLNSTFAALPAVLWMIAGVGLPWALVALPRKDWRDLPLVGMCALAFGPALVTAWLLILGVIGGMNQSALITLPNILAGTLVLAVIGAALVFRKRRVPVDNPPRRVPLAVDERLIVILIVAALVLRWLVTAYWNHTEYDPLWVYGYQGRLYALQGFISPEIGYYPPFMALQYTYTQLAAGQGLDDHAARAVIPFLHIGSILAAYTLGKGLFNRRIGIFTAGIWALYPHVAEWAKVGDLEIPLTFAFTGAAAFLLKAWLLDLKHRERLHYAALAGLFLGIAMFTKPTAGAFILGVGVLVILEMIRVLWMGRVSTIELESFSIIGQTLYRVLPPLRLRGGGKGVGSALPRLEIVIITGLFSIPLGAAWYVRNILYGHEAITLPNPFWLTQALRSGTEFGWLILLLTVLLLYLRFAPLKARPNWRPILVGVVLIAAALLPTMLMPYLPDNVTPNRMDLLEWVLLAAGVGLIGITLGRYATLHLNPAGKWDAIKIAWALALALPYFVTWFYSYSYHYRLSFAIVPLLILPSAVILARWSQHWLRDGGHIMPLRLRPNELYRFGIILLALPGLFMPLYNYNGGWDTLWSNEFPDDFAKLEATNVALAWTVKNLQDDMAANGLKPEDAVIVAPGLQRLPFFFPLTDVRNEIAPTTLEELADADYYVYTQEAAWFYPEHDLPLHNPVIGSLERRNVMEQFGGHTDSSFWSRIYRLREPERRFREPRNLTPPAEPVQVGDFATLTGYRWLGADNRTLQLVWQALKAADRDYGIYIHLTDSAGNTLETWDAAPAQGAYGSYATTFWQPGEYIVEDRVLNLPPDLPAGDYTLQVGFYDLADNRPLAAAYSIPIAHESK